MHNNPFPNITLGLQHGSYNTPARDYRPIGDAREIETVERNPYKYKYNAKEYQDELGLDWYDYGARNYDASLGRWMNVDPLAEMYPDISPYAYAANIPTKFVDYDGMDFGIRIDHDKRTITIIGHIYASKQDMEILNTAVNSINEARGAVLKVGDGEDAIAYTLGFEITTEESDNPMKSAASDNKGNYNEASSNWFVRDSNQVKEPNARGEAYRVRSAINDDEGKFAATHEILHMFGSGHKDGVMKDGASSGGITSNVWGAILGGVGIGKTSRGGGSKSAIGKGHIKSEIGQKPAGFMEGSVMSLAKYDKQVEAAKAKRLRKEKRNQK